MSEKAQLLITLTANGINIVGPIDDPLLCFGLLEMARAHIAARVVATMKPEAPGRIMTVDGIDANRLKNGR